MVAMELAGNEHIAKQLASLYSSDDDSDCVVVFCLKACTLRETCVTGVGEPLYKRQRLGDGSVSVHSRGDSIIVGDPLPGHQLVLRFASDRFSSQLKRWDTRKYRSGASEQSGPAPATVDGRPILRVTLTHEAEEPSARAAIRYAYTGDAQADSIREALEVRQQAANLHIKGCEAACMEIVKAKLAAASSSRNSSETDATSTSDCCDPIRDRAALLTRGGSGSGASARGTATIGSLRTSLPLAPVLELYACEPIWPDPAQTPEFASILAAAKPQLVRYFGDVLRTLNTRSLRQQLLKLPATAVEALLESDDFGTDCESSVLLLLATWMEANHAATDGRTRERLCRQVRLVQLSRSYLCSILPVLALDFETRGPPQPTAAAATTGAATSVLASVAASASKNAGGALSTRDSAATVITATGPNTGTNACATGGATASAACTSLLPTAAPAAWFSIRGEEAAFICSLASAQQPLHEALLAAGRRVYDLSSPWYSLCRRRQCLPATGLVYCWRITERELSRALTELHPGGLCCAAGSFRGDSNRTIIARGFEWWPSIEYRHGAEVANLGLYSQMPEAYQVPASRFTVAKPAMAMVAGVDADLSVHHWHQEVLVDDGVYFSTSKDIWPVGGGRGANVLALRQPLQPAGAGAAAAADMRSSSSSNKGGCGGSGGRCGAAGPLAAWSDYLRDGEVAGTLTLLQPASCVGGGG